MHKTRLALPFPPSFRGSLFCFTNKCPRCFLSPQNRALLLKTCFFFFFFKDFIYLFLERGEGREKERERNISVWLPLTLPQLGTSPATQACALTGNWTCDPLVCRWALNPLSHTSQGQNLFLLNDFLNGICKLICCLLVSRNVFSHYLDIFKPNLFLKLSNYPLLALPSSASDPSPPFALSCHIVVSLFLKPY